MKFIIRILLFLNLTISIAGTQEQIIIPHTPIAGQSIPILVLTTSCPLPEFDIHGNAKHHVEIDGNQINLFIFYPSIFICPSVTPPPFYLPYDIDELSEGDYTLNLYYLHEDVTFPLPENYPLGLVSELQFGVLAPVIIDSSSNFSLFILLLLLLGIGLISINRKIIK